MTQSTLDGSDPTRHNPPWLADFFREPWRSWCGGQVRRFFAHTAVDPLEAGQDALGILYEKLRELDDRPSDALVRAMYGNVLRDLYRHHFGRPRPPTWVQTLGPLWVWLWELVCLRWLPRSEVVLQMTASQACSLHGQVTPQWVEQGITHLNAEQACPERVKLVSVESDPEDDGENLDLVDGTTLTDTLAEAELAILLRVLVGFEDDAALSAYSRRLARVAADACTALALSDEERILLRLRFQEDLSIPRVAACLNRPQHQVRRQLERLLARIRAILDEYRIGSRELLTADAPFAMSSSV
jgi:hypothetical protein